MLLLSVFGNCISVHLLFIPHPKWCNVHRSRHSKHNTAPYRTVKETISRKFSKNYKSTNLQKSLWMQVIFFLKQCHSNFEKSGCQTIGQDNGKSDLFCMISTTWDEQQKLGMEGKIALLYSKTLQVSGK